jgi:hypothetical protein
MKFLQKKLFHSLPLVTFFAPAMAFGASGTYDDPFAGGIAVSTIPDLLLALVDFVLLIGVPIIVICIIYSGFLFVTGGDNEAKVQKARFVFMWTVIGALVLLGAKGIAMAVQSTILSLK